MKLNFKSKPPNSITTGQLAEQRAEDYLIGQGLKLIARNFRCRRGEVDLIMLENDTYVFVEVRFRKSSRFGSALDTVTYTKQNKIRIAAEFYLQQNKLSECVPVRFDVIGMTQNDIQWVKAAF